MPQVVAISGCSGTDEDDFCEDYGWDGSPFDIVHLESGLVYLNKEDAIERAKAMIKFKEIR
ncbi:MAG: hypothetical protein WC055_00015 [Melioribacteraceae bacterium]